MQRYDIFWRPRQWLSSHFVLFHSRHHERAAVSQFEGLSDHVSQFKFLLVTQLGPTEWSSLPPAIAAPICNLGWWSRCIFRSNMSQPPVRGPVSAERHPGDGGGTWEFFYRRRWRRRRYGLCTYVGKWKHGGQCRAGQYWTELCVKVDSIDVISWVQTILTLMELMPP